MKSQFYIITLVACSILMVFALPFQMKYEVVETHANSQITPTHVSGENMNAINLVNAASVTEISRIGKGVYLHSTISPDGEYLLVSSRSGLWLKNLHTNASETEILTNGNATASATQFSKDSRLVYIGKSDGEVFIWNLETSIWLDHFNTGSQRIRSLALSPDDRYLATVGYREIVVWDTTTLDRVSTLVGHSDNVNEVQFTADGETLVSSSTGFDNSLRIWDVLSGSETYMFDQFIVEDFTLDESGRNLIVADRFGSVNKIDLQNPSDVSQLYQLEANQSPEVTIVDDYLIVTTDSAALRFAMPIPGNPERIEFSGEMLHSKSSLFGLEYDRVRGEIKVVNLSTSDSVATLMGFFPTMLDIEFVDESLVTGSHSAGYLWKKIGLEPEVFEKQFTPNVRISNSGLLANIVDDSKVDILTVPDFELLFSIDQSVVSVSLDDTSQGLITILSDGDIGYWSSGSNQLSVLEVASSRPTSVALHNNLSAYVDSNQTVRILSNDGSEITSFTTTIPLNFISFSENGEFLATANSDGSVTLYNTQNGTFIANYAAHSQVVTDIAFSEDQTVMATSSLDGLVILWDVKNQNEITQLRGHVGAVYAIDFSEDNTSLVSTGEDGTVKIWGIDQ